MWDTALHHFYDFYRCREHPVNWRRPCSQLQPSTKCKHVLYGLDGPNMALAMSTCLLNKPAAAQRTHLRVCIECRTEYSLIDAGQRPLDGCDVMGVWPEAAWPPRCAPYAGCRLPVISAALGYASFRRCQSRSFAMSFVNVHMSAAQTVLLCSVPARECINISRSVSVTVTGVPQATGDS